MKRTGGFISERLEGRTLLSSILGDANYDGRINIDDYFAIDRGYAQRMGTYDHGDFDRSGVIDATDYLLLDRAFLDPGRAPVIALHLDAGGMRATDGLGRQFEGDGFFAGGVVVDAAYDVLGTEDDAVFSSYRAGEAFSFSRPIANGRYAVFLEFAEPASAATGERVFDVAAEGEVVLDDFDILAQAAPRTATAAMFNVEVDDGALDLSFTAEFGEAIVSAIVALPTDVPIEARPYSIAYASEQTKSIASASNLRKIGMGLMVYANENRGKYPAKLADLMELGLVEQHSTLANPRATTAVPRGELTAAEQLAWVGPLDDYLYLGAGRSAGGMTGQDVLAYENPLRVAGPINVLFGDGHVELLDRGQAGSLIGFDPAESPETPPTLRYVMDPQVRGSALNLLDIGDYSLLHANDHRGRFAADFGELYMTTRLDLDTFINPRLESGVTPPEGLTLEEAAAWARGTSDYVYLGAGLRTAWTTGVLAHENPAGLHDGLLILFTDGRVEFRESRWAREALAGV